VAWTRTNDKDVNKNLAKTLFTCIKNYSFLHSSPYLVQAIIKAVKLEVLGIGDFIDNRIVKSRHVPSTN